MAGLASLPNQVLENSIAAAVKSDGADDIAELIEVPGVLDVLGVLGIILEELAGIVIVLAIDGVLVSIAPNGGLSGVERVSLADDLNVSLLALQADELDVVGLLSVDVDENILILGIVVAININGGSGSVAVIVNAGESNELEIVVAVNL